MRDVAAEVRNAVVHVVRWTRLGLASGTAAGASSFVFLEGLDRVTEARMDHPTLPWFLPLAGFAIGLAYHYGGGRSGRGTTLVVDELHDPGEGVPARLAPFVLVGTWLTHLFGGSAGREGTALQMSASLTDTAARRAHLGPNDRSVLLSTALAGGFGSVFGVPVAGAVFGLEMPTLGRVRYEALIPALVASFTGDLVVRGLGHDHVSRNAVAELVGVQNILMVAVAGLAFGLVAAVFIALTHAIRRAVAGWIVWPPLRPALGGLAVVGLVAVTGREFLGLSLPLLDRALTGEHLAFSVFALKVLFTAITLGCAFPGGEVTPLFVIGATLGSALATPLGLPAPLLAAVGLAAVFGAAANTPLACTVLAVELFGSSMLLPAAVGCVVAYIVSGHRGIYGAQRAHAAKHGKTDPAQPRLHQRTRRRPQHRGD
jgi:H+/Cl- antiporter ClcA